MLYIYIHGFNSGYSPEGYKVAALNNIGAVDGVQYDSFGSYDIVCESILHQLCGILKLDSGMSGHFARAEPPEGVRTQSVAGDRTDSVAGNLAAPNISDKAAPNASDRADSTSNARVRSVACDKAEICLVGTSLGGFWASIFGNMFGIPAVLINPTIKPHISLRRYVGRKLPNFVTREKNRLSASVPETYREMEQSGNFLILLDKGDQVLDYKTALEWFEGRNVVSFEGGSHRFDHMEESLPHIKRFAERQIPGNLL